MIKRRARLLAIPFVLAVLFTAIKPVEAAQTNRVAIMPFSLLAAEQDNTTSVIMDIIEGELKKSPRIEIIPREQVAAALTKYGNYSDASAGDIAGELRADFLLTGTALKFGDSLTVDTKVWLASKNMFAPLKPIEGRGLVPLKSALISSFVDRFLATTGIETRVANVTITGNAKIGTPAIMQNIRVARGKQYSAEDASDDIKAIFAVGYFDDVELQTATSDAGMLVTYKVREKPLVSNVTITGNDKIDTKQIRSLITAAPGEVINPVQLLKDAEKIKQLYRSKGYYIVEVKTSFEKGVKPNTVAVTVEIFEKTKLSITNIIFRGNSAFSDGQLLDEIKTREAHLFSFITERGLLKEDELRQDVMRIEAFYANNGFIQVKVAAPQITYNESGIEIVIEIQEGTRYRIGKIIFAGDKTKTGEDALLKKLKVNKKEFFDRSAIIEDREYLTRVVQDEGYAFASVTPTYNINDEKQTSDITYNIVKGAPVYINRISISGNIITHEKVIRRELTFTEKELFNKSKMEASHRALNNLDYFTEVDMQPEKGAGENIVDVGIRVKEKDTGKIALGVGYSGTAHAGVNAQISKNNLFGRGQYVSVQGNISGITSTYNISFVDPYLFDYNLWSCFDLWNSSTSYDLYNLDSQGGSVSFSRPLPYNISGYISYRLIKNNVKHINANASSQIQQLNSTHITSAVVTGLTKDTTDSFMFPSRGYTANVYYTYAGLGGDTKYNKIVASFRNYSPLTSNIVMSLYGTWGFVEPVGNYLLPSYEKFLLGGIGTLIGQSNVGSYDNKTNTLLGGTMMMCYNVDVIFPLMKDAGLMWAVFYNMGNVWDTGYSFTDMRHTAGAGIRWFSPIGPIRVELGYVLDRRKGEPNYRVEFSLGTRL